MRCFLAIELPETIRDRLGELQSQLRSLDRVIRWTRSDLLHLTLKFLGEVPDRDVSAICVAIREVALDLRPPGLEIRGVGCFPPRGPARVVWAGIAGPPPELLACHSACEEACRRLGYPPEDRPFSPHLTIGRARAPAGAREARECLAGLAGFDGGRFTPRELVIMQSVLGRDGPAYTPVARTPFAAPGPPA